MPSPSPDQADNPDFITAYAIFEGGGANGMAHVGAVMAAEAFGIEFVGCAGSSAGAIVATLVAVGYRGAEIFSLEVPGQDVVTRLGHTTEKVLDEARWARFRSTRGRLFGTKQSRLRRYWDWGCATPGIMQIVYALLERRGYFDGTGIAKLAEDALREKVSELYAQAGEDPGSVPRPLLFKDLDPVRFPSIRPLKIVVTDLASGQARIFGQLESPDVPVGSTVAASAAIPFAFQPARIDGLDGEFCDGGLVSNLPTWVFAEEKLEWERRFPHRSTLPILAFSLDNVSKQGVASRWKGIRLAGFFRRVFQIGVFGSQSIGVDQTADLVRVSMPASLGTMSFDAPWDQLRAAAYAGYVAATAKITYAFRLLPDRFRILLDRLVAELREVIATQVDGAFAGRLRAAILLPYGRRSLRVTYSTFGPYDSDDRLLLSRDGTGAATAFRERRPVIVTLPQSIGDQSGNQFGIMTTRYEKAMVWSSLRSLVAIPIFADSESWIPEPSKRVTPLGVLTLDSDVDLGGMPNDLAIISPLSDYSVSFGVVLAQMEKVKNG